MKGSLCFNIMQKYKDLTELYLRNCFKDTDIQSKSMSYSLSAGGKRLRPCLFLLVADLYGGNLENLLPFAAGIEMIHTYSLIHDDLPAMDNDDLRRGKPTNHVVFGEAQAILAGDGLLTAAFDYMAKTRGDSALLVQAMALASQAAGYKGMVGGQSLDIIAEGKSLTEEELKTVHKGKTGALISLSLASAAILCDAPREDIGILTDYGYDLGILFQIADDILDVESSAEITGKPQGSDEEQGKTTYISLLGKEGALKAGEELLKSASLRLNGLSVDAGSLKDLGQKFLYRDK